MPICLKNFAFGSPRSKARQSLTNAAHAAQVLHDPRTGGLRIHDHSSLPAVGMYSVLTLEGAKILVRYICKLPFVAPKADSGDSSYSYVRPTLEAFEVKRGTKFTLLVGDMHFIAEIDSVLSVPPSETYRTTQPSELVQKNSTVVEAITAHEERTFHSSTASSIIGHQFDSPKRQSELLSTPSQFSNRNKELPTPPPSVKVQSVGLPSIPHHECHNCVNKMNFPPSPSPSPVPRLVIPRQRVEPTSPASRFQQRNISVVQGVETDQKLSNGKCHDSESTQETRTMVKDHNAHTQPHSVAVPSTRTPNSECNSPSQRVDRISLQREWNQGMQLTSSPRLKVLFHVDDYGRPLPYPSPATTKLDFEGSPVPNSKAKAHALHSLGETDALGLSFELAPMPSPILPYSPHQGSRQRFVHHRSLSEHEQPNATLSRHQSDKKNIPSNPEQYHTSGGKHHNKGPITQDLPPVSPTKTARPRHSSPPASLAGSTYGSQSDVSQPLDSDSPSSAKRPENRSQLRQVAEFVIEPQFLAGSQPDMAGPS